MLYNFFSKLWKENAHMKKFNKKFIFITIVGILSVLLLSIFSVNIIVNKINSDSQKASEANARNRLYNILSLASNEKENNSPKPPWASSEKIEASLSSQDK